MSRSAQLLRVGMPGALLMFAAMNTAVAAPTTTNVALNKPATVSSYYSASTNGSKAVDGNAGTYWRTKARSTLIYETIQIDLGVSESISRVVFQWNAYYATNYWVDVSPDNLSWKTVHTVTTENGGTDIIDFAATPARYVRMTSRAWNNNNQRIRLNEMEVYRDDGSVAPPPVAGAWSVVASPNGVASTSTLGGVAAVSANDVWAVGDSGGYSLAQHWDGAQWSVLPTPNPDVDQFGARNLLRSVSASSSGDIWAVGVKAGRSIAPEAGFIVHWDGASWVEVTAPTLGDARIKFYGVSALSSTDAWAVGSYWSAATNALNRPLAARWNGSSWSVVPTPAVGTQADLYAVTALAADNAWAVGQVSDDAGYKPLVMHWDGSTWSVVNLPGSLASNIGVGLRGIAAVSANDIWAVGTAAGTNLTMHYNGSTWSVVNSPNDVRFAGMNNALNSVSAVTSNDVWAVGTASRSVYGPGDSGRTYYYTTILHWDGSAWAMVDSPDPNANNNKLQGVARVNASQAWAVGESGNPAQTLIQRYSAQ